MDHHIEQPERPTSAHILFFIGIAPMKLGGIELFAYYFAEEMRRRGKNVAFCFSDVPSEEVRALLDLPNVILLRAADQTRFSPRGMSTLWNILRQLKPETVVYSFGGILRPLPWICKLAGVKRVVYNDHSSRTSALVIRGIKRAVARLMTSPVDTVIAVSKFVRDSSLRERLHRAPCFTVLNGIDLSHREASKPRADFLARYGVPPDHKVVTQVSWMVPEKGVDTFLRAAAELLRTRRDVHFILAGEGRCAKEYQQLSRDLGISENVIFTGMLRDPMASGIYAASDVFCLASRWKEACGLVILEAMSFGTPVVASRIGGIHEYVRDGTDGLLVEGDHTAFASAIASLLDHEELRRQMGKAARARAEADFSVQGMAQRYCELLQATDAQRIESHRAGRADRKTRISETA